ncbi:MAG: hypothetical protein AVDCRST_MAG13-2882 [uncultured Solirubrobacteraceae bacterium]|uniref:DUF4402 domain-containing protein n=1 Tax=uncultured Solirubrobacteraceae bacterium TaxID=1162706 RepID=A0A6J4T2W6_9ACTN|nr:MAG: hypothetical protein AVDCRST_MAG13-2882 [uncultured Solirubrobacteraceae bacterium]
MKGLHVVALGLAVAATAAGATVAVGQGTGGTVGPGAVGTKVLEVRIKERDVGFHCDRQTTRQCFRNPRLGSLSAGTGTVYEGTTRVGTAHFTNIITKRGRSGGEIFLATVLLGDGTITLQGASAGGEDAPPIPSSITGGTGAYAGARGVETEEQAPGGSRSEFRIRITLTFIP